MLVVIHGWSVGCRLTIFSWRKTLIAALRSDIRVSYFSSQVGVLNTFSHSFWVIQHPKARYALSWVSRTLILLIEAFLGLEIVGLARIAWWSDDPTLGSREILKVFGLLVRNQSNIAVSFASLVLRETRSVRLLECVISFWQRPLAFGLKSPVITTRALDW